MVDKTRGAAKVHPMEQSLDASRYGMVLYSMVWYGMVSLPAAKATVLVRQQGLLTRINSSCSLHKHTHIYKSLLNLQGTFMQLLFDMLPCSLSFHKNPQRQCKYICRCA